MLQLIRKIFNSKKNEQGLSLIESLIATAIVGIGFVGVFSLDETVSSLS